MGRVSGKRILAIAIYLVVVITLTPFIVEGLVRLIGLAPRLSNQYGNMVTDPYLPFKPRPFSMVAGRSASNEYDFEHRYNSMGFRDVEHPIAKPAGTFRILGLGDSFALGAGAPFEQTFLCRLEAMLNARPGSHPQVEIIKAGISDYFPEPERLLLQHYGLMFRPDVVLVAFLPNDVIGTFRGLNHVKVTKMGYLQTQEAEELGATALWLYLHSHIARILLRKQTSKKIEKTFPFKWPEVYRPDGFHEKDWQTVESEFEKMIGLAHRNKAEIVFIHIPQNPPWNAGSDYPGERLSKWCAGKGVTFVDTLPALRNASRTKVVYWKKDGHCNGDGYGVIAETIYSVLTEKKLVP